MVAKILTPLTAETALQPAQAAALYVNKTQSQSIDGNFTLAPSTADALLTINAVEATKIPRIVFQQEGVGFGTLSGDGSVLSVDVPLSGVTPTADTHLATKLYVDDGFMDLTTAQSVSGLKSFDTGVQSSVIESATSLMLRNTGATQTHRIDMFDTYTQVDHDLRISAMGTNDLSVATKVYVDNFTGSDDLKYDKSGGLISGNVDVDGNLVVDRSLGNTPLIAVKRDALYSAALLGYGDYALLRNYDAVGAVASEFRIDTGYMYANTVLRALDPVGDTDLTTKSWVQDLVSTAVFSSGGGVTDHGLLTGKANDDHPQYHTDERGDARYLPLSGGDLTGDLSLSGGADTRARINSDGALGISGLQLNSDNALRGLLYTSGSTQMRLRYYNDPASFGVGSELIFTDGAIQATVPIGGQTPVSANQLATKGYVDTFLPKSSGTLTNSLSIDVSAGNSTLFLKQNGINKGAVTGAVDRMLFEFGTADFEIFADRIVSDVPMRGVDESHADSYTTKSYVDAAVAGGGGGGGVSDHGALSGNADDDHPQYLNVVRADARYYIRSAVDAGFVDKTTAQSIAGAKSFTTNPIIAGASPGLIINSSQNNQKLDFQLNGVRKASVFSTGSRLFMAQYNAGNTAVTSQLVLDNGFITASKEIQGQAAVANNGLVTKAQMEAAIIAGGSGGTVGSMATKNFWQGTQAAYDAIGSPDADTLYFINQ